jgi:hypothetical protein
MTNLWPLDHMNPRIVSCEWEVSARDYGCLGYSESLVANLGHDSSKAQLVSLATSLCYSHLLNWAQSSSRAFCTSILLYQRPMPKLAD